jgi:hypothetical protein
MHLLDHYRGNWANSTRYRVLGTDYSQQAKVDPRLFTARRFSSSIALPLRY